MMFAQVLPRAADLPDNAFGVLALIVSGVIIVVVYLCSVFSKHLSSVQLHGEKESEKDRELHREVSRGLIASLNGVQKEVRGHGRKIDKLAVAITGTLIDDDSNPEPDAKLA